MRKRERWCQKLVALILVTAVILTGQVNYCPLFSENSVKAEAKTAQKSKQKRIIGKTETATIYDLGDGKKKAEIYPEKVRYQEEDGEFADYDTSLTEIESEQTRQGTDLSEYAYQTSQSEQLAYFPERLSEDTPVFMG